MIASKVCSEELFPDSVTYAVQPYYEFVPDVAKIKSCLLT